MSQQAHQVPSLRQQAAKGPPGSLSPPNSGCSEFSTPEQFAHPLQHITEKSIAHSIEDAAAGNTRRDAASDPKCSSPVTRSHSFSLDDLDAAAAMLDLPKVPIGAAPVSSNADRDTPQSQPHEVPADADGSSFYDVDAFEGSAASAAELLLAAGRLASVSSQTSGIQGCSSGVKPFTFDNYSSAVRPGTAANAAAASASAASAAAAAMAAAALAPASTLMTPAGPSAALAAARWAAAAAGGAAMMISSDRTAGCSCLKPCKPHTPCQQCGSSHSPGHTWRAGPAGPGTLCNACGTRYSRSRQKQMAAAAAAAAAAGYGAPWDPSFSTGNGDSSLSRFNSGGSSSNSSGGAVGSSLSSFSKSVRPKQGRVSKAGSSSKVVKGTSSKTSKLAAAASGALEYAMQHQVGAWAAGECVSGASGGGAVVMHGMNMNMNMGGAAQQPHEPASEGHQHQWWLHWQAMQQQQQQQQGQNSAAEQVPQAADQQQQQQQQQQLWLYSQWMQQHHTLSELGKVQPQQLQQQLHQNL